MNNIENIYKFADSLACETKLNEPMKKHTSFKIGGNAAVYIKVDSLSKLCKFVRECKLTDTKYFLLGNGSNILVDDNGMDCAVIKLDGDFKEIRMRNYGDSRGDVGIAPYNWRIGDLPPVLAVHICQVILPVRSASSSVHVLQGGTVFLLPVQAVHIVQRTGARIVVGQAVHVFQTERLFFLLLVHGKASFLHSFP